MPARLACDGRKMATFIPRNALTLHLISEIKPVAISNQVRGTEQVRALMIRAPQPRQRIEPAPAFTFAPLKLVRPLDGRRMAWNLPCETAHSITIRPRIQAPCPDI